ncbi:hypothetical protein E8E12_000781 [Didymella heteroderae]|uniref:Apple domain-containing protein n=1 Tax=Didymella heteroderae TaxID=1769908 RepID=A0A9P5BW20_9PLEO|nr:hypothetical protein E8E12_000781 [Didymella heteroderae]
MPWCNLESRCVNFCRVVKSCRNFRCGIFNQRGRLKKFRSIIRLRCFVKPYVVPSGFATSSAAAPTVTSTLASCPSDNGKTINTAAGTFVIECYVDRAGGDLSTVYPDGGFYGCIQACANTPNCVDVSYSPDGPCYLKVAQSTPNTNSGIWGARLAGQAASSAASGSLAASSAASSGAVSSAGASTRTELSSVAPTATSSSPAATATGSGNSPSCPSSDGQIFYYNGDVYDIQCYTDYAGGDLPNSPQYFSDFGDCINACATDEACNTISFVGGTCYLKSTTKPGNSNQNVWGARQIGTYDSSTTQIASSLTARVSTSGAASTTGSGATATSTGPAATSSVVCPGSDGQTINTQAGTFVVECGIDRAGGDMSNSPVYPGSYENCVTTCAARDGCVDVSYANGPCYLKSVAGNPSQNVGIIGGRLISGPSSSGAVSSSSGAASASGASSTGASPTGASSTGDSSPAAATSRAATSGVVTPVQTVTVTTTIGGTGYQCTCTPTSGLASGPASSGAASTPAASATAGAQLDCPASDGSTYTSSCGATYKIECYSDRYGDDITRGTSYVNSLDECIADCDSTDGCVDVSYVPESPGPCYKKSSVAQIRQNDNIYGALQLTGCKNTKLKIHRKRVIRSLTTPEKMIQKRGVYGPDYTYTQGTTTVTQTTTSTSVRYATVTMTPASVGTTTRTVYTTASATTTVTNGATVVQTQQATITTCPAVTAMVF